MPRGLDGFFIKYGITQEDLAIINQACEAKGVNPDWLQEEVLAKFQERKNSGKPMGEEAIYKIVKKAVDNL